MKYATLQLPIFMEQLHHEKKDYSMIITPIKSESEALRLYNKAEDATADLELLAGDKLIYCNNGLFYCCKFLKR
jgi:midasin (ATPase involved in ribosome maturation)